MTPEEVQAWRKQYWELSDALESIRAQELFALTEAEANLQIRSLGVLGEPWRARPNWSGLVEQQAILHNLPID
jgi:hypothetical protein